MGRHALRITILLGILITLVGGTGIFAVFSDRATTGTNDVTTVELGKAADLQIAAAQPQDPMNSGPFMCDPYTEDLDTPFITFTTNIGGGNERFLCLFNAGSSAVDLSLTAIDITDLDVDCTGDEAAFGDTTCGLDGAMQPQAGELGPNLAIETDLYDCTTGAGLLTPGVPDFESTLSDLAATPQALQSLQPNSTVCVRLRVYWRAATSDDYQVSQSDEATWRFAFDGTVPSN
ncbi:MAG TPA: hypothetical protein VFI15_05080 [Candidatus Limnocylindrales bacterium]|nr:hypothetical protein [Candidatus Limnocylindrales bacterium]